MGQMFLVLFNILEHRHLKETGKREAVSQYGSYPGTVADRDDFGKSWKSTTSEQLTEDSLVYEGSSGSSMMQRPTPEVEPKSRYNPLMKRGSNEL